MDSRTIKKYNFNIYIYWIIVQVSHALRSGGSRSLLLIDEFGKGTAPIDGMALLMAVISNLLDRGNEAPLALFSSHYHEVS